MTDLARLTFEDFAPLVGQSFAADFADAGPIELEVVRAGPHAAEAPATDSDGHRTPFTVEFRGPAEPILPQRIYRLGHETTGPLEIFIVPLAVDAAGARYEAIFA